MASGAHSHDDLAATLASLAARVSSLEARLAALEQAPPPACDCGWPYPADG